jgi:oligopeptide transport system substrate-binding protein
LRVGITSPGSVDPGNAYTPAGQLIASTMCDTLLALDPDTGELRPGLASLWRVSDHGQHMTIKLRKGLRYSDGTKVTARSVVQSLSRLAKEEFASEMAPLIAPIGGYATLHGDGEATGKPSARTRLSGARATDPLGLEIRATPLMGDLLRALANPATAPISPSAEAKRGREFGHQPVCSGPYRMTNRWAEGDRLITLEAVPGYRGKNTTYTKGGTSYAARIEFHVFDSEAAALDAYKAGALDVAPVPAARLGEVRSLDDLVQGNGAMVEMVGLPTAAGSPLRSKAATIAFSQAIDRERLVRDAYGDTRVPARGYLPPALGPLHRQDGCGANAPLRGDVASARARLAEARIDLGREPGPLKLYFNEDFGHAKLATALAAQWSEAFGIVVQPTPLPWEQYLQQAQGGSGFDGAFRVSWTGMYQGADAYLGPLFSSDRLGSTNLARFSDRRFDRALADFGRKGGDDVERRLGYQKAEDFACDSLPLIPVAFTTSRFMVRKTAFKSGRGRYLGLDGTPLLRELWAVA